MTLLAFTVMQVPANDPAGVSSSGCQWWNFACQGGTGVVDAGMSAITRSIASGAAMVLGQIVKIIDGSTQVPLADAGYRQIYYGFLGLAAPLIGVILFLALVLTTLRRDPATLGRAVIGVGVAGVGGAFYIAFAQLLVALDNWLSHGIVAVTGQNLSQAIARMAGGFEAVAGTQGDASANMLLIILMMIMLLAGLTLWFVLVLRKIAILVVVAFAPLLIAGYLWAPTRAWVRKATEALVALVFTKSAIFGLFGIGLALLSRSSGQSLSDFVGTVVLLCGACFAPLLMLKLVHFAADTHVAGEMMGTLKGGMQPVLNRVPRAGGGSASGRHDLARQQGQGSGPPGPEPARATGVSPGSGSAGAAGGPAAGGAAAGGGGAEAAAAASPAGPVVAGAAIAAQKTTGAVVAGGQKLAQSGEQLAEQTRSGSPADSPVASGPRLDRESGRPGPTDTDGGNP